MAEKETSKKGEEPCDSASRDDPDPALLYALECPVCRNTLSPPVEQCNNGHCICGPCRKKLKKCPVCNGPFSGVRSRIAEDLVDQVLGRRCENHNLGCSVREKSMGQLNSHQLRCEYRPCQCRSCDQIFMSSEVLSHWKGSHKDQELQGPEVRMLIISIFSSEVSPLIVKLIEAHDEMFWYWRYMKDQVAFFGVAVCRKTEESFTFQFVLRRLDTPEKLVFSGRVHSSEDHKTLEGLQPCSKCVCATREFLGEEAALRIIISKTKDAEESNSPNPDGRKYSRIKVPLYIIIIPMLTYLTYWLTCVLAGAKENLTETI